MEILKAMGAVAGIGGLALGVFLLLYRDFIRRFFENFSGITKKQSFQLMRLFLILVWLIAVIGIIAFVLLELQSKSILRIPFLTPEPEKKPIIRIVCRADSKQRCPDADAFVGCGNAEEGVQDLRATCSLVTSFPVLNEQAGRCGLMTWKYTCIPK